MEEYKSITDYPNYEVSNKGNVKNIITNKILKPTPKHGYDRISLCKSGKVKAFSNHRLVAETFIVNLESKRCVDHINNNRTDNRVENLRWATDQENQRNKPVQTNNVMKTKGISFDEKRQQYRARIVIDGIDIHLGYFLTVDEAKQIRLKKANELFGVFTHSSEKQPPIKLKSTVKLFKQIDNLLNDVKSIKLLKIRK